MSMLKRAAVVIVLVFGLVLVATPNLTQAAESVVEVWVARYTSAGIGSDYARAIAVDSFANVYVTGHCWNGYNYDYVTVKYNSNGVTQWIAPFNGASNSGDYGTSVATDGSGNVYVTGTSYGSSTGADYATLKYSSSGVQQWVALYDGPWHGSDSASQVAVDGSGNVYVSGRSQGSGGADQYAIVKYDSDGGLQWVARYSDGPWPNSYARALAVDGSGNVYVTGSSRNGGAFWSSWCTVKYDNSGSLKWVAWYHGPETNADDSAYGIAVDGAGNVFVTGRRSGNYPNFSDYATIKYDSNGNQVWLSLYNGLSNSSDSASNLVLDTSGNIYVTGSSYGGGTYNDYATVKYNTSGVQQWVSRYNSPSNDHDVPSGLAVDSSENVYVTGSSVGINTREDYETVKYGADGTLQWVARYIGPPQSVSYADTSAGLALDDLGNVYVTGTSYSLSSREDYATVKYTTNHPPGLTSMGNQTVNEGGTVTNSGTYSDPFVTVVDFSGNEQSCTTCLVPAEPK